MFFQDFLLSLEQKERSMKKYYLHVCWQVQQDDKNISISDGFYIVKAKRGCGIADMRKAMQKQMGSKTAPNIMNMTVLPKRLFKALTGEL